MDLQEFSEKYHTPEAENRMLKIKCLACKNKDFLELNSQAIEDHLRGKIVAGIYSISVLKPGFKPEK